MRELRTKEIAEKMKRGLCVRIYDDMAGKKRNRRM